MEHTEKVTEQDMDNQSGGSDAHDVNPTRGTIAGAAKVPHQVVNVKQTQSHVEGAGHHKSGASDRRGRTLYEILDDFAERIPHEIKEQFPDDFIENIDHYLHGASKRWPPSS